MTYQLVLFGENGVVIASDTQATSPSKYQMTVAKRVQKIIQLPGIVCTFAGDDFSKDIAEVILKEVKNGAQLSEDLIKRCWRDVSGGIPTSHQRHRYRRVMFVESIQSRFEFRIWSAAINDRTDELDVVCVESNSKTADRMLFAGDEHNPARYIVEQFYKSDYKQENQQPAVALSRLKKMAAHTILMGGRFNHLVGGLEMIVGDQGAFKKIEEPEIAYLTNLSKTIHTETNERFDEPDLDAAPL